MEISKTTADPFEIYRGSRPGERNAFETRCNLRGKVVDTAHEPIEGALLWFQQFRFEGMSQHDGGFEIPGVPSGIWNLIVQKEGYRPTVLADVVLNPGVEELGEIILEEETVPLVSALDEVVGI